MQYILKELAEKDMADIWKYTVKKWNINQAITYIDSLEEGFHLLIDNPEMCRENFEIIPPVRIYPCQSHLIIYLILPNKNLNILRILHKSMDINLNM